ncbi:MAG TPA: hypothetical protein VL093_00305 [Flavipsychrobacter sp.]|nr:hypothetical protein [Flavipsychrobacter sp.]
MPNRDYESMTKEELYEIASRKNIARKSELSKEELVKALRNEESGSRSGQSQSHGHRSNDQNDKNSKRSGRND